MADDGDETNRKRRRRSRRSRKESDVPKFVSMEYALKRMLRAKANFDVLEGFLGEMLQDDVEILEILESESNREREDDKQTRVDLKARLAGGEIVIIEVQGKVRFEFLPRLLYSASQVIVEHLQRGQGYQDVVRVISVSIMYGAHTGLTDYVYHGTMQFAGVNDGSAFDLTEYQLDRLGVQRVPQIFPQYYLLCADRFDDVARTPFDEWVYFLKNQRMPDKITARGLQKAAEIFDTLRLPEADRIDYHHYFMAEWARQDEENAARVLARAAGLAEGIEKGSEKGIEKCREEGREEGRAEVSREIARQLLDLLDDGTIAGKTGLTVAEVRRLRRSVRRR